LQNLRSFSEPIDDADDGNADDNGSVTLYHGIPQKTGRVRIELNSDQREGSVATGPNAIRGRLRELENILVLVQIKDKNWTKYGSNLRNLRSFSEPIDDADDGNADDNCSVTLYHGIPQKTGRVRIEVNSDQREGSVATGPNASANLRVNRWPSITDPSKDTPGLSSNKAGTTTQSPTSPLEGMK
jgi:hypothetical protein